jgi:hypothetical protein
MFNTEMGKKSTVAEAKNMKCHMELLARKDDLDSAMSNVSTDLS